MITFDSIEVEMPQIDEDLVKKWLIELVELRDKEIGELSYYFCNDDYMLSANREYLDHDYFTDILTFDAVQGDIVSGDILISLDTVKTNAEKYNEEYNTELHRVIAHGVLHLLGYKDKTDDEQKEMTEAENTSLSILEKMS